MCALHNVPSAPPVAASTSVMSSCARPRLNVRVRTPARHRRNEHARDADDAVSAWRGAWHTARAAEAAVPPWPRAAAVAAAAADP